MMNRRPIIKIVLFFTLCLGGWTTGQTIYDAFNFYKPMTNDYDVRLRGHIFLPPCVKSLMNCWEIIRQDLVCKYGLMYRIALESMCMDLRFQCTEYQGALPFDTLNVSTWNFCPKNVTHQCGGKSDSSPVWWESGVKRTKKTINMRPMDAYSKNDAMGVNNFNDNQ